MGLDGRGSGPHHRLWAGLRSLSDKEHSAWRDGRKASGCILGAGGGRMTTSLTSHI